MTIYSAQPDPERGNKNYQISTDSGEKQIQGRKIGSANSLYARFLAKITSITSPVIQANETKNGETITSFFKVSKKDKNLLDKGKEIKSEENKEDDNEQTETESTKVEEDNSSSFDEFFEDRAKDTDAGIEKVRQKFNEFFEDPYKRKLIQELEEIKENKQINKTIKEKLPPTSIEEKIFYLKELQEKRKDLNKQEDEKENLSLLLKIQEEIFNLKEVVSQEILKDVPIKNTEVINFNEIEDSSKQKSIKMRKTIDQFLEWNDKEPKLSEDQKLDIFIEKLIQDLEDKKITEKLIKMTDETHKVTPLETLIRKMDLTLESLYRIPLQEKEMADHEIKMLDNVIQEMEDLTKNENDPVFSNTKKILDNYQETKNRDQLLDSLEDEVKKLTEKAPRKNKEPKFFEAKRKKPKF